MLRTSTRSRISRFELRAVTDGSVAYADRPGHEPQLGRGEYTGVALEHEDLASSRIDDRQRAWRAGRKCFQGRDTGGRDVERQRQTSRGREPDAHSGEAARADTHGERVDLVSMCSATTQESVDVFEQRHGVRDPLAENFSVGDERTGGDLSRRIEGEDQHGRR